VEKAKPLIVTKTGARTLPNVAATSKGISAVVPPRSFRTSVAVKRSTVSI
jgi:hypothetical protein